MNDLLKIAQQAPVKKQATQAQDLMAIAASALPKTAAGGTDLMALAAAAPSKKPQRRSYGVGAYYGKPDWTKRALAVPKGAAIYVLSLPQIVGSLAQEFGERMGEKPDFWEWALTTPLTQSRLIAKYTLQSTAKKTGVDKIVTQKAKKIIEWNQRLLRKTKLTPTGRDPIENFLFNLGSGGASLATAIALSYLTGNPTAAAVAFGTLQKAQLYQQARKAGVAPKRASQLSTLGGLAEGALEYLGLDILFGRRFGNRIINAALKGGTEGLQEWSQQFAQNIITKIGWDKSLNLLQGTWQAGGIGIILGVPAATLVNWIQEAPEVAQRLHEAGIDPFSQQGERLIKTVVEAQGKKVATEVEKISKEIQKEPEGVAPTKRETLTNWQKAKEEAQKAVNEIGEQWLPESSESQRIEQMRQAISKVAKKYNVPEAILRKQILFEPVIKKEITKRGVTPEETLQELREKGIAPEQLVLKEQLKTAKKVEPEIGKNMEEEAAVNRVIEQSKQAGVPLDKLYGGPTSTEDILITGRKVHQGISKIFDKYGRLDDKRRRIFTRFENKVVFSGVDAMQIYKNSPWVKLSREQRRKLHFHREYPTKEEFAPKTDAEKEAVAFEEDMNKFILKTDKEKGVEYEKFPDALLARLDSEIKREQKYIEKLTQKKTVEKHQKELNKLLALRDEVIDEIKTERFGDPQLDRLKAKIKKEQEYIKQLKQPTAIAQHRTKLNELKLKYNALKGQLQQRTEETLERLESDIKREQRRVKELTETELAPKTKKAIEKHQQKLEKLIATRNTVKDMGYIHRTYVLTEDALDKVVKLFQRRTLKEKLSKRPTGFVGRKFATPEEAIEWANKHGLELSTDPLINSSRRLMLSMKKWAISDFLKSVRNDPGLVHPAHTQDNPAPKDWVEIQGFNWQKILGKEFTNPRFEPNFADAINEYILGSSRAGPTLRAWRKLLFVTKTLVFYNPLRLGLNDIEQSLLAGVYSPTRKGALKRPWRLLPFGNAIEHIPKAVSILVHKGDFYREMRDLGLFSNPTFEQQNIVKTMQEFAKGLDATEPNLAKIWRKYMKPVSVDLFKNIRKTAWTFDEFQRVLGVTTLMERGLSLEDAVDRVKLFLADYSRIPNRTARGMADFFLVPRYRISMLRLWGNLLRHPVKERESLAIYLLTKLFLKSLGYITGGSWVYTQFYRVAHRKEGGKEDVITLPGPVFELEKWMGRPLLRTLIINLNVPISALIALYENRDWRGKEIYDKNASDPVKRSQMFAFLLRTLAAPWGAYKYTVGEQKYEQPPEAKVMYHLGLYKYTRKKPLDRQTLAIIKMSKARSDCAAKLLYEPLTEKGRDEVLDNYWRNIEYWQKFAGRKEGWFIKGIELWAGDLPTGRIPILSLK